MTDERWRLAFAIYETAAPLTGTERQEYIHTAAPDKEVADKVLAMLDEISAASDGEALPNKRIPTTLLPSRPRQPSESALARPVCHHRLCRPRGDGESLFGPRPGPEQRSGLESDRTEAPRLPPPKTSFGEAQAASALNHPNIVTVYEVIRSGPAVAIAMELVTGTSLRHYCGTVQPVERLVLWGRQIAHALAEAHARGIVHRDIKPENLMLRPDGYIKVLDFGLARHAGANRADDELALGTLGYMSPEEIEQRPITAASDIYSLGVVLYELASGTNPFRGESAGATTRMILGLAPSPLPEKAGAIPKELDRLVRSMLNKSAAQRPTAAEVAAQLGAIAVPRVHRRVAAWAVWAVAALVVCVIGGGISSVACGAIRTPDLSARKLARR